jgi:hypothetical protein
LALERPSAIKGIITQNGNAYIEGFGPDFWKPLESYWASGSREDREKLRGATGLDVTKWQYVNGAINDGETVDPATYYLDAALMAREGNADVQVSHSSLVVNRFRTNYLSFSLARYLLRLPNQQSYLPRFPKIPSNT